MVPEPDQESLLSIFLMEAWDTVAAVEEGLGRLREPHGASATGVYPLLVVAHRLKGSASLHGFPRLAELAGAMERILERVHEASPEERGRAADFLGELAPFLKRLFDGIGATGREPTEAIELFQARYPAVFAPPSPAQVPAPAPAPLSAVPDEGSERLFRELDRFFAENQDVLVYFGPEAAEHLETSTASLLALERGGRNEDELATLFRAVHTLKGAAYTVGCAPVGDLAHLMEDLLAAVREDRIPLGPPVIEAVFAGVDAQRLLLSIAEGQPAYRPGILERALESLKALLAAPLPAMPRPAPAPAEAAAPAGAAAEVPAGAPAAPARPAGLPAREPAAAAHRVRVSLDRLDSVMALVGELLIARTRLDQRLLQLQRVDEQLRFTLARMAKAVGGFQEGHQYTPLSVAGPPVPPENGRARGAASPGLPGVQEPRPIAELFAELEFDRYDDYNILARSVGEISADLAEVQAQATALIRGIREDTAQIQRLTARLRTEITRTRMVPVGTLFGRVPRQVREAARAAGVTVNLEVSGEGVELDTTIIEQMADPLLHLVQNAIAHGIEPEAERRQQGKPAQGTLRLHAYPQGGFVLLEVADDGRGMDAEALKREAVAQGYLTAQEAGALTYAEALNLVFLPGFSTARHVTAAAGRGVGMDVVQTNVSRLNGEITLETEAGVGTRVTIKLPLTLVISEALLVRVGGEILAVPMNAVKLILRVRPQEILPGAGGRGEAIHAEEQVVDLIRTGPALGLPVDAPSGRFPVVLLRTGGLSFAVAVDELLGKEEIVIKPLGPFLEDVGPFTGATISGEGRVILLVDPGRLLEAGQAVSGAVGAAGRPAEASPAAAARRAAGAVRRVLLVDDSISVRKFVGQMLERAGFQVLTASDGAEALQMLRETPVHVVVTDLEMPRVSGYELIEDLQRRPATQGLPVVVLTTRAGEKHQTLARRLGVRHYVTKPVDEESFVRLVAAVASPAPEAAPVGGAAR